MRPLGRGNFPDHSPKGLIDLQDIASCCHVHDRSVRHESICALIGGRVP